MDIEKTVQQVCEMANRFRERGNTSMIDLMNQSGYSSNPSQITETLLATFLHDRPHLVESWLVYSDDQRCSPAWMFAEPSGNKPWILGYVSKGGEISVIKTFVDPYAACASFIKKVVESLSSRTKIT